MACQIGRPSDVLMLTCPENRKLCKEALWFTQNMRIDLAHAGSLAKGSGDNEPAFPWQIPAHREHIVSEDRATIDLAVAVVSPSRRMRERSGLPAGGSSG